MPAFERAMKEHKAEIDAITNTDADPAFKDPNFENTIAKMEMS